MRMDPDEQLALIGPFSFVLCICSLVIALVTCGKDRQPRPNATHGESRIGVGASQKAFYGGKGPPLNHSPVQNVSNKSRRHKPKTQSQRSNVKPMLAAEPLQHTSHRNTPGLGQKPRNGRSHHGNHASAKKQSPKKVNLDVVVPANGLQSDPTQKDSGKSVTQPTLLISATAGTPATAEESPTQGITSTTQMVSAAGGATVAGEAARDAGKTNEKTKVAEVPKPAAPSSSDIKSEGGAPEKTHAPAPRRDLKRDRSLALKALVNYKEKHEISERSKRKRDEETARQKEANNEPEIRNHEEKGVMLEEENDTGTPHEKEEDFDNPNEINPPVPQQPPLALTPPGTPVPQAKSPKMRSTSFPTVDTPDIPPTEVGKITAPENPDKVDSSESEPLSDEKPTEQKKVAIQGTTFTPDDQRQFKPIGDIPADDITLKRETKKKRKKKRKSKKKKKTKSNRKEKPNKGNKEEITNENK